MSTRNPDPRLPTRSSHRIGRIRAAVTITIFSMIIGLLATPAFAQAAISLKPSQGEPADGFVISGQGFGAGEIIHLSWDGTQLGSTFFTDSNGEFSVTRSVPDDAEPGDHTVTAADRPPSQLTAQATFTVVSPSTTTTTDEETTTSDGDTTTTTEEDSTNTTSSSDDDATSDEDEDAAVDEEASTTTDAAAGTGVGAGVSGFEVTPSQASPGTEIVVEASFTRGIRLVGIWLGESRLGSPASVGQDGSLRATRTVPDLAPGTYWLKLETVNGKLLDLVQFEVMSEEIISQEETPARFARSSLALGPLEWAVLLGILVLAMLSVWFMWRKPEEEGEAGVGEKPRRWWQRWREIPEESEVDVAEPDLYEVPAPGFYNLEEIPTDE